MGISLMHALECRGDDFEGSILQKRKAPVMVRRFSDSRMVEAASIHCPLLGNAVTGNEKTRYYCNAGGTNMTYCRHSDIYVPSHMIESILAKRKGPFIEICDVSQDIEINCRGYDTIRKKPTVFFGGNAIEVSMSFDSNNNRWDVKCPKLGNEVFYEGYFVGNSCTLGRDDVCCYTREFY